MEPVIRRCNQRGAVAIEFAAVFLIFFMVFYAIVGYSVPLLMLFTFNELAAESTRAAVAVEPGENFEERARARVKQIVDASWLPKNWREPCYEAEFARVTPESGTTRQLLEVCMQYKYNENPVIPLFKLPGGVNVPSVPDILKGESNIRL